MGPSYSLTETHMYTYTLKASSWSDDDDPYRRRGLTDIKSDPGCTPRGTRGTCQLTCVACYEANPNGHNSRARSSSGRDACICKT